MLRNNLCFDHFDHPSSRVWVSETFGGAWASIPANAATDDLGSRIRSLRFASFNTLYAGT